MKKLASENYTVMKNFRMVLVLVVLVLLVGGCARTSTITVPHKLFVTYKSFPIGATVIEKRTGKNWGTTPVTLKFTLNEKHLKHGKIKTTKMNVFWLDGRKIEGESIIIDLPVELSNKRHYWEHTFVAAPFDSNVQQRNAVFQQSVPSPQQNNYNIDRVRLYAAAKSQYNSALAGYNIALKNLDSARNMKGIANWSGLGNGSRTHVLLGLFNKATSHGEVQMRERELLIAQEKLQRAKTKMMSLDLR